MKSRTRAEMSAFNLGAGTMLAAVAVLLAAFGFQHIGGYIPCELCYLQRIPYYVAIPVLFVALTLITARYPRVSALLFFLAALAFLANAGIGVYQAGAEWKYWPGPTSCSGEQPIAQQAGNLLDALKTTTVVRCDVAQFRMLGLSFAGWNVVVSFLLFLTALQAAFRVAPDNRELSI